MRRRKRRARKRKLIVFLSISLVLVTGIMGFAINRLLFKEQSNEKKEELIIRDNVVNDDSDKPRKKTKDNKKAKDTGKTENELKESAGSSADDTNSNQGEKEKQDDIQNEIQPDLDNTVNKDNSTTNDFNVDDGNEALQKRDKNELEIIPSS